MDSVGLLPGAFEAREGQRESMDWSERRSARGSGVRADEAGIRNYVEHSGRAGGGTRVLVVGDEGKSI